jgi:hypothetical protein
MIEVLDRWKEKQDEDKPLLYVLNFSGEGRVLPLTMNVLQTLDSLLDGELMKKPSS